MQFPDIKKMRFSWATIGILLIGFIIPIEHKYDEFLHRFSTKIIPKGLTLPVGFDQRIHIYATDILALGLFILGIFFLKTPLKKLLFERGGFLLWGVFLSALISLIASPYYHYFTVYTRLVQLLTPIFLYSLLTHIEISKKTLQHFFFVIAFAGTLQAIVAITQYFSQKYLGLRLFSESKESPSTFYMENASRWVFDLIFSLSAPSNLIRRASGTLPHSNILGGFFVFSLLSTLSLIANLQRKRKLILSCLFFLQFFAMNLTFSRSALFGLLIGILTWIGVSYAKKAEVNYRYIASLVVLSFALCSSLLLEQWLSRGGLFNYTELSRRSDMERIDAQSVTIQIIKENPIIGVGYQQLSDATAKYGEKTSAHNIYLFVLSEMGGIAFFCFLLFLCNIFYHALKAPWTPEIATLTAFLVAFLFIGFCDFHPILSQQGKLMLFLTSGLLISHRIHLQQKGMERADEKPKLENV